MRRRRLRPTWRKGRHTCGGCGQGGVGFVPLGGKEGIRAVGVDKEVSVSSRLAETEAYLRWVSTRRGSLVPLGGGAFAVGVDAAWNFGPAALEGVGLLWRRQSLQGPKSLTPQSTPRSV
eukprot:364768-Chlamydomonas_euryale.AAC.11